MEPKQYVFYNRDEMKCQHPIKQIRIADDNTGAYCRKCCDWISVTDVAVSVQFAEQAARIAELEAGLEFVHNAHISWKDFEETKQWWDAGDEAAQKLAKNLLANKAQS